MRNEMSEAQRLTLQAAAAREDRFLPPPRNARGAAARTIAGKLIDAGWAKEMRALSGAPIWRRDAASGSAFTLKLTAKGLKAAAGSNEESAGAAKAWGTATPIKSSRQPEHRAAVRTAAPRRRHANRGRCSGRPQAARRLQARERARYAVRRSGCDDRRTDGGDRLARAFDASGPDGLEAPGLRAQPHEARTSRRFGLPDRRSREVNAAHAAPGGRPAPIGADPTSSPSDPDSSAGSPGSPPGPRRRRSARGMAATLPLGAAADQS